MIKIELDDTGCFSGCTGIIALAGWLTAAVRDAMMTKWLWLIFDIVFAPLGAIRGFMMWFGWA